MISVCVAHSISSSGLSSASKFTLKVEPDQQPLKDADESRRLAVLPFCMTVELPVSRSLVPPCPFARRRNRRSPVPRFAYGDGLLPLVPLALPGSSPARVRGKCPHFLYIDTCLHVPLALCETPFLRKQCVSLRLFCSRPQTVACKIPRKMYKTHIKRDPLGVIRR